MKTKRQRKKVPSYWWDMEGNDEVIVESDDDRFPVVARFKYDPVNGGREAVGDEKVFCCESGLGTRVGQAAEAIEKAEALIADLKAGRRTPSCANIPSAGTAPAPINDEN